MYEDLLTAVFIEGQRYEAWLHSEQDSSGTWHNLMLFRRDGRMTTREPLATGVDWHLPHGAAVERGKALCDDDLADLLRLALRPRPPLM